MVWESLSSIYLILTVFFYCRKIEEKRGVTVSDSGIPEMKSTLVSNGPLSQSSSRAGDTVVPTIKSRPAWDEDWGPTSKGHTPPQNSSSNISSAPVLGGQSITGNSIQTNSVATTSLSSNQTVASCLPVNIEWPPRNSTGGAPRIADSGMQATTGASSTSNSDDVDPFADWPPRPSGSLGGGSGVSNNGAVGPSMNKYGTSSSMSTPNSLNSQTNSNASWTINNKNTSEPMRQSHGILTFNSSSLGTGGLNSQSSIGFQKQNQGISSQHAYDAHKKFTDLGSIFAPSKNENNIAPRLAPPPSTAVGRGRGRGRGVSSTSRSTQNKSSSGQPPLMDLL